MKTLKNLTSIIALLFLTSNSFAADVTIEMLNKLGNESMVYSEKIVRVNVGDTVFWKSTNPGHNVEFIKGGVPEGVDKFKTKFSKDAEYTFTIPGIYAYWCTPHKSMGMIGFVVVGDDKSNLENIKKIKYYSRSKKIAPDLINSL
jgi:pseudoazurin|tara:strand:+ start:170 stop:604 length:435 start_codon:yes stop_codon:yes gene_type:complete